MLTQEWIKSSLPKTIKTADDYKKVMDFLKDWKETAGTTQEVYDFLNTTGEKKLKILQQALAQLTSSLCDYNIKYYEKLSAYFDSINNKLTQETKNAISIFLTEDCTVRLAAVNAMNNIIELLSL